MKNQIKISLTLILMILSIVNCENSDNSSDIFYKAVNKEYVFVRNVHTLQVSNDEISNHVDSILKGLINVEFVSTGQKMFDLNANNIPDIGFEIIDLNKYNPNGLPENFDSLAARVIPVSVEILDNSTYSYPDALELNKQISDNGHWSKNTCVLGTFTSAGQFKGKGERYLGIRLSNNGDYNYGWIKLYCSQHNDTLRIIEYAYNQIKNSQIKAGQKE
jgi:hypothetical protein